MKASTTGWWMHRGGVRGQSLINLTAGLYFLVCSLDVVLTEDKERISKSKATREDGIFLLPLLIIIFRLCVLSHLAEFGVFLCERVRVHKTKRKGGLSVGRFMFHYLKVLFDNKIW